MPASATITLSKLAWSTPDGRQVFSEIDLSFTAERVGLVGRNGVGKSTLLALITGQMVPSAGAIKVDGSIGMLRQVVQIERNSTVADLFGAREALALLQRAEDGSASLDDLAHADWTLPARMATALGRVGLNTEPQTPLASLSGGQRTRAALAGLIFGAPDFILLDEPTNNLDRAGRRAVIDLLADWPAGAIIVSHDRELLDTMDAIVALTSLGARRYGGNWTSYHARKAAELAAAQHDLADAAKRIAEVDRRAQVTAERKARRDGAGNRQSAKGDMPRIDLGNRKNRSEGTSGANARVAEQRRAGALDAVASARARIEVLNPFSVTLAPSNLPPGKTVLVAEGLTGGYAPDRPIIRDLSFAVTGPERVAICGPNGSGKTTLLALVTGTLAPSAGTVRVGIRFAMLDQAVSALDAAHSIRDNFRRLNPEADENACRAALAKFAFRADAAVKLVRHLSGGELLRAGLACTLGGVRPPPLLILDEPTNHLDIESIEAVEAGLRAYDGALLVVSHDEAFLEAIGISRRLELGRGAGAGTDADRPAGGEPPP